jgi:murein DD-endopeptidase MepM/ murein hydrolase activator NlpD
MFVRCYINFRTTAKGSAMNRIQGWTVAVLAAAAGHLPSQALAQPAPLYTDSAIEGAWYDPRTSGQGLMIDALPGGRQLFVAWFTFADDGSGAPRWYSGVLATNGPVASGPITATTGGRFDTAPDAGQTTSEVGTLRIDFGDCGTTTVTYSLRDSGAPRSGSFVAQAGRELVADAPPCTATTKLRWPHAAPGLDDAAYAQLAADVFIPNNFGQHQGGVAARPGDTYFHDGIDIFAANGTPIHALEAGTVRDVGVAGTNNFTVTVESDATPANGWSYVHLTPSVAAGQHVVAGQVVGTVQFAGLEHLHLSRVRRPAGATDWSFATLLTVNPVGFFELPDTEPPLFRDGLLFLRDGTDVRFADDAPLSGKVDIAAGVRDPGPLARRLNFGGPIWDRHSITWIEYSIEGQGRSVHRRAFDFTALEIGRPSPSVWSMTPMARVVYQPILLTGVTTDAERVFHYYLLTNGTGGTALSLGDAAQAWDTAARDASGQRVFPDGTYRITVRAADASGNVAQFVDTAEVRNG